jgi:hypothetical protein
MPTSDGGSNRFSTGETCALVIKTFLVDKQIAHSRGKCQPFFGEAHREDSRGLEFPPKGKEHSALLRAGVDWEHNEKGRNHESVL